MLDRLVATIVDLANDAKKLRAMRKLDIGANMTDLNLKMRWMDNGAAGFEHEAMLVRNAVKGIWPPAVFLEPGGDGRARTATYGDRGGAPLAQQQ